MMRNYPLPPGVPNLNTPPLPRSHDGQHRRLLTPEPPESVTLATVKANGTFFQKLPTEIRTRILHVAFGDRTIHVDLICGYPIFSDSKRHGGLRQLPYSDKQPEKDWAWRSSVCHRFPPSGIIDSRGPGYDPQPCDDECIYGWNGRNGFRPQCEHWPGEGPKKCSVGATGWLLACKQAYREGIHVLYASNTFHTASKAMILNMHNFFQQQRLNAITSVEIIWEFTPWILPDISEDLRVAPPLSDIETFRQFLKAIPGLFLNIKKLYVSLQGDMIPKSRGQNSEYQYSTKQRIELVEKNIIWKVDEMVPYLKPHVDFSIAYPTSTYAVQRSLAFRQGWTVKQRHETGEVERHWRPLAKCKPRTGYWVCLGDKDVRRQRARGVIGHQHMPARVSEKKYDVFFRS
ncbi:hypothetical protein NW761_004717 [Fusarium oxysporum]|uniref:DUF7730 domain-containing protein n=1 Tax=Fusarium oxysporum f. sp. raphani TaxID=96318 RepID=A0A8J5PZC7_FUSOX|nr:hypothetical protein Forpi1262_v007372 [Fusarium oxysporum f. sp. raphani]KAJ4053507.1 hypothetical protein NW758_003310 [Fusarium oxysporum]KAJ4058016.1 hypothetical protein NW753_005691 [Fusarium oxysporum]KAJ4068780.1 hypothetical protein NW763_002341 [Fusarium oxysporum]KAJ4081531.1 hypothetical protein NW756_010413 [Fusarium oxysporum]